MSEAAEIFGARYGENGTRMVKSLEADPKEFEAVTVNEYAPGAAAVVPEIVPEESSERPEGRKPSARAHVMGDVPMAERFAE